VEHPAAERHGPLPLDCYAFGADGTGCPRHPGAPPLACSPGAIPERGPPEARLISDPIMFFGVNAVLLCIGLPGSVADRPLADGGYVLV
jgi:hypothetical protein